jgi:hypothetical protein
MKLCPRSYNSSEAQFLIPQILYFLAAAAANIPWLHSEAEGSFLTGK